MADLDDIIESSWWIQNNEYALYLLLLLIPGLVHGLYIAYKLVHNLYRLDHNWIYQPLPSIKFTTVLSAISLGTAYFLFITSIALHGCDHWSQCNEHAGAVCEMAAAVMYVVAVVSGRFSVLRKALQEVEIRGYHCIRVKWLYLFGGLGMGCVRAIPVILIWFFLTSFDNIIYLWCLFVFVTALWTGIVLLLTLSGLRHTAQRYLYGGDWLREMEKNGLINDRAHEIQHEATRLAISFTMSIIYDVVVTTLIIIIFILYNDHAVDSQIIQIIFIIEVLSRESIFLQSAYFAWVFGHREYSKWCCCCHNFVKECTLAWFTRRMRMNLWKNPAFLLKSKGLDGHRRNDQLLELPDARNMWNRIFKYHAYNRSISHNITEASDHQVAQELSAILDNEISNLHASLAYTEISTIPIPTDTQNLATQCPDGGGNASTGGNGQFNDSDNNNTYQPPKYPANNDDSKDDGKGNEENGDDEKKDEELSNPNVFVENRLPPPTAELKIEKIRDQPGWVRFDASESMDVDGDPCNNFVFLFGDGTPPIIITSPVVSRPYSDSGTFMSTVIVTDKYGQQDQTSAQHDIKKPSPIQSTSAISSMKTIKVYAQIDTLREQKKMLSLQNQRLLSHIEKDQRRKPSIKHKKKGKKNKLAKEPNYDPPKGSRLQGNVQVRRAITNKIIPTRADLPSIKNLYSYLDKLTALQWDKQHAKQCNIGDKKILDYDLHDKKTGESLYCIITRQDERSPSSRKYKWIMDSKLYNTSNLEEMNLSLMPTFRTNNINIMPLFREKRKIEKIVAEKFNQRLQTAMNKIKIYYKQKVKKNQQVTWTLSHAEFKKYCKNNQNWKIIPIIMSYDNIQNAIQYLVVIKTERDKCDIGVSMKYDSLNNSIFIKGIHIDKDSILEQHQLAMPYPHNHTCDCLNSWNDNTKITNLTIGDKNRDRIEIQKLKEELEEKESMLDTMRSANKSLSSAIPPPNQSLSSVASFSISAPAFATPTAPYRVQGYPQYSVSPLSSTKSPSLLQQPNQCNNNNRTGLTGYIPKSSHHLFQVLDDNQQ